MKTVMLILVCVLLIFMSYTIFKRGDENRVLMNQVKALELKVNENDSIIASGNMKLAIERVKKDSLQDINNKLIQTLNIKINNYAKAIDTANRMPVSATMDFITKYYSRNSASGHKPN
jgi:preprotein translocase subunit YajC